MAMPYESSRRIAKLRKPIPFMRMNILRVLLLAAGFGLAALTLRAATPPPGERAQAVRLLSAISQSDYASFIAEGDDQFHGMPREQFAQNAAQLAPRLNGGYKMNYLGELRKGDYHVTLWKMIFTDGKDDALFVLSVRGGKVAGFNVE